MIGAPMHNFTIPSQLKAWIDRILVAGKTFSYSEKGVQGLAAGKRVIVAVSRGGFWRADTPMAAGEHLETYLRWGVRLHRHHRSRDHQRRRNPDRSRAAREGASPQRCRRRPAFVQLETPR